ncbi:MAG: hypothetical protein OXS35_06085, partial [Dehalococcoidia bacterium]|nr:hypothetical protein [Dehalococcoidia bacterium]
LTYAWTSSGGGSFAAASALSTTWTAPAATSSAQAITLTLTVTDAKGLKTTATDGVTVNAKPASQEPTVSVRAIPTSVDGGGVVTLIGSVRAPGGYRYTTAWTSDGGGIFAEASDLSTVWTAPAATATAQAINLTLTVTGKEGSTGSASATVTITVVASSSSCLQGLGTLTETVTKSGTWADDCASKHRNGRYARFYSFTLSERTEVTIELTSTDRPPDNTYLLLLSGAGKRGRTIATNNDIDRVKNQNSRIVKTLAAGTYTVEATTLFPATEGGFTLKIAP